MKVQAELMPDGKRIAVRFPYDPWLVRQVKGVPGARWNKTAGAWFIPADWSSAHRLRAQFGEALELGAALRAWGHEEKRRRQELHALGQSATATLTRLPTANPKLYEAVHLGPKGRSMTAQERSLALAEPASFQAADVAFAVKSPNPLNANEMGLGKTLETIAAIFEAGTDEGPNLVIAPKSAQEGTWPSELMFWQDWPVFLASGSAKQKAAVHDEFIEQVEGWGGGAWLVINPEQIRMKKLVTEHEDGRKEEEFVPAFPLLFEIEWNNIIIDECHDSGLMNPQTLAGKGTRKLKCSGKRFALSGTPIGGKPIKLFGILQFLNPDVFTSKWRFAEQYLEVGDNGFGKTIGGIRRCPECRMMGIRHDNRGECDWCDKIEDEFWAELEPYIIRRTKLEALPWLPPKQYVDVWVEFGSDRHERQYRSFEEDAMVEIGSDTVAATNIISEYTRCSQMAWGRFDFKNGRLVPTRDSGKLAALEEKLEEIGIFDKEGTEQAVIFSQFKDVVNLIHDWLAEKGVNVGKITGDTNKKGERNRLKEEFQGEGGLRVLVISTKAGGTSLTLDRASNVFVMDQTWNPDDNAQAIDRCHRASRIHQVTAYTFKTKNTLDEYKNDINVTKTVINEKIMDLRRFLNARKSD